MSQVCSSCGCTGRHTKPRARSLECASPASCWQWDHTCYAKRMARRGRRVSARSAFAPASIAGVIVPNVRMEVAA
jgi:hypothetical protein